MTMNTHFCISRMHCSHKTCCSVPSVLFFLFFCSCNHATPPPTAIQSSIIWALNIIYYGKSSKSINWSEWGKLRRRLVHQNNTSWQNNLRNTSKNRLIRLLCWLLTTACSAAGQRFTQYLREKAAASPSFTATKFQRKHFSAEPPRPPKQPLAPHPPPTPSPRRLHFLIGLPSRGDRLLNGFIGTVQCLSSVKWVGVEGILSLFFQLLSLLSRSGWLWWRRVAGEVVRHPPQESLRLHPLHPLL